MSRDAKSSRGVRWPEDQLKAKLVEFGVTESEMVYIYENHIDDGDLTVRKLRPIANDNTSEHEEIAGKVKAMLKSIGELRSKSIFAKGYRAITGSGKEKSKGVEENNVKGEDIVIDDDDDCRDSDEVNSEYPSLDGEGKKSKKKEMVEQQQEGDNIEINNDEEEASLYTVYTVEEWDLFYGSFLCGGDVDDQVEVNAHNIADFDGTDPQLDEAENIAASDAALIERLKILSLDRSRFYLNQDNLTWSSWRSTDGMELYTAPVEGHKGVSIRTTCRVRADKDMLKKIFLNDELITNYDENLAKTETIWSDEEAGVYCKHFYYHPYFPARQRDTVFCSVVDENAENGDILISTVSLPRKMYKDNDYTRAFIKSNSSLISPSSSKFAADEETHCQVTFVNHVDTGGTLPTFLTDTVAPLAVQKSLKRFKKYVEAMDKKGMETSPSLAPV